MSENKKNIAIEVEDLVTHYGSRKILDGINLKVNEGEIMIIMGGSGSGKSTLLRYLLGLGIPTSGNIRLLGKDITNLSSNEMFELRKNMGVAFQGGALLSSMTIGENVQLPLHEHTDLDQTTMDIMARMKLEVVNLGGFENLMPSELSGGMVKRAAVARAIIMDPKLMFFDEPSAGLDPVVSAELDELILKLRDAMNMTIVVVTHELDSAFKIADRITVLDRGHILMSDTVEEIKNSNNERIQSLLNRRPSNEIINADIANLSEYNLNYDGTRAIDGGEGKFREGISSGGKALKFRCFITKNNSKEFPNLTKFINELQSKKTYLEISKLINKDLSKSYVRVEVICDRKGFWLKPHCDIKEKLISCLLFVNKHNEDESLGTDFYDKNRNKVKTLPYRDNYGYFFSSGSNTWHGMEKKEIVKERRCLQVNYVTFKTDWPVD